MGHRGHIGRAFLEASFQHLEAPQEEVGINAALQQETVRVRGDDTGGLSIHLKIADRTEKEVYRVRGGRQILMQYIGIVEQQVAWLAVVLLFSNTMDPTAAVHQRNFRNFRMTMDGPGRAAVVNGGIGQIAHPIAAGKAGAAELVGIAYIWNIIGSSFSASVKKYHVETII